MTPSIVVDHYTLILEKAEFEGLERVRALATNMATSRTVEASLSSTEAQALLESAYGE